jgi:hypothetical protein
MEFFYLIGVVHFAFLMGSYVQTTLLKVQYSTTLIDRTQKIFLGIFIFLFLNFLYLEYLSVYLNLPWFYGLKIVFALYTLFLFILHFKRIKRFDSIMKSLINSYSWLSRSEKLISLFIVAIWIIVSFVYVYENDALEYIGIAQILQQNNSLVGYPPIETSWLESLYAPSTHPPYFHIFLALFTSGSENIVGLRFLLIGLFVGMAIVLLDRRQYTYGLLIICGVPLIIFGIQGLSVEIFRLPFFASGLVLFLYSKPFTKALYQCYRYIFALAMMISTHSLGLLMGVLVLSTSFLVMRDFRKLLLSLIAFLVSIVLVAPQYIANTIRFGTPVQDSSPILDLAQIAFFEDLKIRRQISTFSEVLVNGSFRPMIDFSLFGFAFAIGTLLSFIFVFRNLKSLNRTPLVSISALLVITFTLLQFFSSIAGIELLIKNVRYALSIFPCILVVVTNQLKQRVYE